MTVHVQYQDLQYDYVGPWILDRLIAGKSPKSLKQFYRKSEERWVDVYHDPIRGIGGTYLGAERRQRNKAA